MNIICFLELFQSVDDAEQGLPFPAIGESDMFVSLFFEEPLQVSFAVKLVLHKHPKGVVECWALFHAASKQRCKALPSQGLYISSNVKLGGNWHDLILIYLLKHLQSEALILVNRPKGALAKQTELLFWVFVVELVRGAFELVVHRQAISLIEAELLKCLLVKALLHLLPELGV